MNVKKEAIAAPMRTTKAEQSEATRAALIGAARPLFAERGYGAVATEEIVRAAGVTRGALYHHFAGKEELFAAVYEEVEADLGRDATSRAGGRPSMLQDVMRGRRTEIDHLNGFVVEEGRRLGVKTPFNEQIVTLYRARGSRLSPDPANLEPLLEMLP